MAEAPKHEAHEPDDDSPPQRSPRDDGETPITSSPALWRLNGCGLGFYGRRDHHSGTYVTTHCICLLFIPIIPIGAYRVADSDGGYYILTKAPLSGFARKARATVLGLVVAAIALTAVMSVLQDPDRLARKHVDEVLATVAAQPKASEASLQLLTSLDELELGRAGSERGDRVGAEIMRLTAGLIPRPFTRDSLDQASRLVQRYQTLLPISRGRAAQKATVEALSGFVADLGTSPEASAARLALLRHQEALTSPAVPEAISSRLAAELIATVNAKQAEWPAEALELLLERPNPVLVARADELVARLAKSPSTLLDVSTAIDAWAADTKSPDRGQVTMLRGRAEEARKALQVEKPDAALLKAHLEKYPWDQYAVLELAGDEASEGKLDEAAARIAAASAPGLMIRDLRLLLGRLRSAQGKLDEADALLSSLVSGRLARYTAAALAMDEVEQRVVTRIQNQLRAGDVPEDLRRAHDAASDDAARVEIVNNAISQKVRDDAEVTNAREAYIKLADVVPASLALGTVKLRRAQAMPEGEARDAMLGEAERAFLAIRSAAEGQPEFRIGLGEIYARLGKVKESEAEFAAVLAQDDPRTNLRVAEVYRTIGNDVRAKEVATQIYGSGKAELEQKYEAAITLALLSMGFDDAESESWLRRGDQKSSFVRISLAEIEARKLKSQGKRAACAAAYADVATRYLAGASPMNLSGYNNAGLAQMQRFRCSGDLDALADAEAAMEKAYRASRDNALVIGNYAGVLLGNAKLRVLGKRINLRALPLDGGQADALFDSLARAADDKARQELLAALAAHPTYRRGEQVFAEYEVLASSSVRPYHERMRRARLWRDEAAMTALLERARKAKGLDTSQLAEIRKRWNSGDKDAELITEDTAEIEQLEAVANDGKLDARTRAVAFLLVSDPLIRLSTVEGKAELARRAGAAAGQAAKLWPALDTAFALVEAQVDEAGITADAKRWKELRRTYTAVAALAKLQAEGSPAAAAVLASPQGASLAAIARADHTRPGLDDLRLARLLRDPALEARAKAVLDDLLIRKRLELDLIIDPADPTTKEDLAFLDKR